MNDLPLEILGRVFIAACATVVDNFDFQLLEYLEEKKGESNSLLSYRKLGDVAKDLNRPRCWLERTLYAFACVSHAWSDVVKFVVCQSYLNTNKSNLFTQSEWLLNQ